MGGSESQVQRSEQKEEGIAEIGSTHFDLTADSYSFKIEMLFLTFDSV